MTRLQFLRLALVVALSLPAAVLAPEQSRPPVSEGDRVRVTSPVLEERVIGTVASIGGGALVVEPAPGHLSEDQIRLQQDELTKLEVSRGDRSHWLAGGLVGLGAGAAAGIVVWQSAKEADDDSFANAYLTAGGAVVGALAGAAVGALIRTERWEVVDRARLEPLISLAPQSGPAPGLVFGVRVRI